MLSSRTKFLMSTLTILNYKMALKALDFVIRDMCIEKGFKRHDGSHYYHHLVDVAQILLNYDIKDENIIIAALLHDYVEDVEGVTFKSIEESFNKEVAEYVRLVTKVRDRDYKNEKTMMEYLEQISQSEGAALIKTADRIHNFSSMRESTSISHMEKQMKETEKFYIPFFKKCRNEYPKHQAFFFQAKTIIEPMIFFVKELVKKKNEDE